MAYDDNINVKGNDGTKKGVRIDAVDDNGTKRLTVDAKISSVSGGVVPTWSTSLRYEDINASVGGVARDTAIGGTYVDIYNQTGSGDFVGFLVTMENTFDDWDIKLIVDSTTIFELCTADIAGGLLYGYDGGGDDSLIPHLGISNHSNTLRWKGPSGYPMKYTSSIQIQMRYTKAGTKKFKAGLLLRTT